MVVALGRRCVYHHHHHGVTVVYGFAPIITTSPPHIHTRQQPRPVTWSRTVSTLSTKQAATTAAPTIRQNSRDPHHPQHNPTLQQCRNLKRVGTALSTVSQCWKTFSWRRLSKRIRHRAVVFVTSFLLIWNMANVGSLSSSVSIPSLLFTPPVAHAASTTATAAKMERVFDRISQSDVDQIIHHYVQQHMFDDDMSVTDPVVGTYREAYTDHMTPKYPMALRQIITDSFRGSTTTASTSNVSKRPPLDVGLVLTQTIQLLQRTLGCTEMTATIVLSIAFVVAGPSAFLLFGMIVGGISKRNMDQVFKKRYGETYTVDATIKKEPVVELPSDDDEEEDDDDDDDNDEDDDEDDSKTKGKNKDKKK
jgi:hypothetical protein